MAAIADAVYTIERLEPLAAMARQHLKATGHDNVHVKHADGTLGWRDGGPAVPEPLKAQLKVGGRLVIPVGTDRRAQELVRITRRDESTYDREDLADLRFVPLVGAEGWEDEDTPPDAQPARVAPTRPRASASLPQLLERLGEPFDDVDGAALDGLLQAVGDARIVLIGEASHGTSEFYRMRARITRELIERQGFTVVAAEADWPDAARIDHYVRHREVPPSEWLAFARFPTWMWRNAETRTFVDWLHERNAGLPYGTRCGFYGLDLYGMYVSVRAARRRCPGAIRLPHSLGGGPGCLRPCGGDRALSPVPR